MSLSSSAVPFTAFRGQEIHPALSPDASQVAFVWNGPKQDNFDIYTMRLGSDKPVRNGKLLPLTGREAEAAHRAGGRRAFTEPVP